MVVQEAGIGEVRRSRPQERASSPGLDLFGFTAAVDVRLEKPLELGNERAAR